MVVGIFGESCVGKSTLADHLKERLGAETYSGKDYLRLAKNEAQARLAFQAKLRESMTGAHLIYVITEREHLALLPEGALRVLVTADLETIKERFARRTGGRLPPPVVQMLERKHGMFDDEARHIHMVSGETDPDTACEAILSLVSGGIQNEKQEDYL